MSDEPTRIHLPQGFVPAGTRLSGIYEIDSPLAKGGMGEVYRGHTIETGDPVAIKLIRSDMADNEAVLALFRREASALSRLHHEAIIRYFVFSLDPGLQRHYLAMELVEGEMLSSMVARGPLPPHSVAQLITRLASGLQAAHERGIIHRDLSPDNVIVEGGLIERARIIDFGIARSTRIGDTTVIGSGFAGKYNYVSPEQLGLYGGEVTGRSDIYSLGLVIAQCLLGRAVDMGGSQVDVVEKRRRVPDLAGVDAQFRPLLERMLQPDPARRPADMAEVASWRSGGPTASSLQQGDRRTPRRDQPDSRPKSSGKWMAAVAGIGGLLITGGVVGYMTLLPDGPRIEQPATPEPKLEPAPRPEPAVVAPQPQLQPQAPAPQPQLQPQPQAPAPQPPPVATPVQKADQFLRDFDAGDCFLALPTSLSDNSAEVDAFGLDRRGFDALDTAFARTLGFEAMIDGGQVTQAQCPALRLLTELRRKAQAKFTRLEINRTALKSNELLGGNLVSGAKTMALFTVDHLGNVQDVSNQLLAAAGGRRFNLRITSLQPGRAQPMLLLAVTAGQPLAALRGDQPLSQNTISAVLREASTQPEEVAVAAKYFKVE